VSIELYENQKLIIFHIEDPVIEKIMNRDLLVTNDPPIDKQYHKIHDEDIDRLF
jgi:hypothetical protein